ncbi:MAG TPA: hypothetical protein VKV73_28070 [Chloroflexota bacterium]|nr:hypothetical protein [Chloroflexota bacterium]
MSARPPRPGAGPRVQLRALVTVLTLLAVSSAAATAVERMGASLHYVPGGWPASGCLEASVVQLGAQLVTGHGSLCITDSAVRGTLDLAHLQPGARYREWIAYFESSGLCSGAPLKYQIPNFTHLCSLVDLEGVQPQGTARELAEWAADALGEFHADGPVGVIDLRPHAQVWLLVSRPAWSPSQHYPTGQAQDDTALPVGRAEFELP